MKRQEKVSCHIKGSYVQEKDPQLIAKYNLDPNEMLHIDSELKTLVRIDDMYKDGTTLHKTLKKGIYTASPYSDSRVASNY